MSNGEYNGTVSIVNRVGMWAAIAGMAVYILNIGQWVGAADEKFKDAETVENSQQQIKERITKLEEGLDDLEKSSSKEHDAILKAIEKLERKLEERDNDG